MPKFNNLVGILAISAAITGCAVTLGTAVTATSANAVTMGGYVGGGGYPGGNFNLNRNSQRQKHKAANGNKNKNKQWQHERQHQGQHQFLLRDFTLVLTPFQKTESDSRALPYNWQSGQSTSVPTTHQNTWADSQNNPRQQQDTDNDSRHRNESKQKQDADNEAKQNDEAKQKQNDSGYDSQAAVPEPAVTVTVTAAPVS
jgi:hypothetical protein